MKPFIPVMFLQWSHQESRIMFPQKPPIPCVRISCAFTFLRGVPFWQVTGTQVLLYIGASCFPMPGASGASEGTFYLAFSPLFGDYLTTAMLIWRLASYYLTIVLGYIAVVAERVTLRRAET